MCKIFSVSGYWKDDKSEFDGEIISEYDSVGEDEDDNIFFYGMSEDEIKENIKLGEADENCLDFVLTSYEICV